MRLLKRFGPLVIVGVLVFAAAQALAASATVSSAPVCCTYQPANPKPSIPAGGTLAFRNNTVGVPHSVVGDGSGPDGKALFASPTFSGAGTKAVGGVQYLSPGTYHFHCSVHPTTMKGTLTVASGTPVARPRIVVAILSQTLSKVRRTGMLQVSVAAKTKSDGVALVASTGKTTIAKKSGIDLAAGQSQDLGMALTDAGRRVLKGKSSARVDLRGTVPFGSPATASRVLTSG
jgi:plastocyanin